MLSLVLLFYSLISEKQDVLFVANVQHDCSTCQCGTTTENVRQERQETGLHQDRVKHTEQQRFVLNMHALHNAALIRETLPRELTRPKPYIQPQERRAAHDRSAELLQVSGPAKREATKAKAKATREKNKQAKKGGVVLQAQVLSTQVDVGSAGTVSGDDSTDEDRGGDNDGSPSHGGDGGGSGDDESFS